MVKDYYKILGLSPTADENSIRRAYRVLARRYHPDVNPGGNTTEKFQDISEAYRVLHDDLERKKYDEQLEYQKRRSATSRFDAYRSQQETKERDTVKEKYYQAQKQDYDTIKEWQRQRMAEEAPPRNSGATDVKGEKKLNRVQEALQQVLKKVRKVGQKKSGKPAGKKATSAAANEAAVINKISIIEVTVSIQEAAVGVKKTVEIPDDGGTRKIAVSVPAGVRTGSIVRLRASKSPGEELVLITRVKKHRYLSMDTRGLTLEVPITIHEAIVGASITVPTLEDEMVVKVPPNTQSGDELRIKAKGVDTGSERGDLFLRFLVKIPESQLAVGIKEKSAELEHYYEQPVRHQFTKNLLELDG